MSACRFRIGVLVVLSLAIGGGPALMSSTVRGVVALMSVPSEGTTDAAHTTAEYLPLFVPAPHAPGYGLDHCHEVVPEFADDLVERMVLNDHAARGPPAA